MSFGRAGRVQRAPPPPPAPLTPADIREYAPYEYKEYEGTPYSVSLTANDPDRGMQLTDVHATKLSSTKIRVPDTPYTRVVVPILMKIKPGFKENEVLAEIETAFKEQYPDVKIESEPGRMFNTYSVHQFHEKLKPYIYTFYKLYEKERYKRAEEGRALADREKQLSAIDFSVAGPPAGAGAGSFGGRRRRKTHRRAPKKSKKHGRRRTTRKH